MIEFFKLQAKSCKKDIANDPNNKALQDRLQWAIRNIAIRSNFLELSTDELTEEVVQKVERLCNI